MKKAISLAALLCIAVSAPLTVKADEPCNMTLCMWGKVSGSNKDNCEGEIKKFFKKQVKKKGSFLPDHTADARESMLRDECPASMVPSQFISQIISKVGRLKG
ncbi:killer protein [Candidatus Pantoea soli]|nr:killer protein [Pantoea soli]